MSPEELAGLPEVARLAVRLCEIPSPSREEGAVAEAVRRELVDLGADVFEDDAAERLPSGCGNIVARVPPTIDGGVPIALCAHLDTVPVAAPIEVALEDGHLTNRHPAILGADDKAAVAVMLEALRRVHAEGRPHAGIELLLTPCEEIGLLGAHAFDPAPLRARLAFVFDHVGPIGDVIVAAPTLHRIEATFCGTSAHAGISPELGRSAIEAAALAIGRMPLGRVDERTVANVGSVHGGSGTNVVADRCSVTAEARSHDERALATQITAMMDALTWAASDREVDLESRVERRFSGYRLSERDPQVALALGVLERRGHTPRLVETGGGSDANALIEHGLSTVNLCNGMIDVHSPGERIAVASLTEMVEVTLGLVDAAREAE